MIGYDKKRICFNKIQYKTRIDAVHNQTLFQLNRGDFNKFYVYKCTECNQYHTSKDGISDEIKNDIAKNVRTNMNIKFVKRLSCWAKEFDVITEHGVFRISYDSRGKGFIYILGNVENNEVFSFYIPKKNFLNNVDFEKIYSK